MENMAFVKTGKYCDGTFKWGGTSQAILPSLFRTQIGAPGSCFSHLRKAPAVAFQRHPEGTQLLYAQMIRMEEALMMHNVALCHYIMLGWWSKFHQLHLRHAVEGNLHTAFISYGGHHLLLWVLFCMFDRDSSPEEQHSIAIQEPETRGPVRRVGRAWGRARGRRGGRASGRGDRIIREHCQIRSQIRELQYLAMSTLATLCKVCPDLIGELAADPHYLTHVLQLLKNPSTFDHAASLAEKIIQEREKIFDLRELGDLGNMVANLSPEDFLVFSSVIAGIVINPKAITMQQIPANPAERSHEQRNLIRVARSNFFVITAVPKLLKVLRKEHGYYSAFAFLPPQARVMFPLFVVRDVIPVATPGYSELASGWAALNGATCVFGFNRLPNQFDEGAEEEVWDFGFVLNLMHMESFRQENNDPTHW